MLSRKTNITLYIQTNTNNSNLTNIRLSRDICVKKVSHGLYRLVHSAIICRNSFLSSGCNGFQPFILAYFLAFSNLPYLLSERFILLTVVFILLIYDVVSGCKVTTFFRNGNGFVNIFELT